MSYVTSTMITKVTTVTKLATRPEITTSWSIRLTRNTEESLPPFVTRPMIRTTRDTMA